MTVDELAAELTTIHLDRIDRIGPILARVRGALEVDALVVFAPVRRLSGWSFERLESDGLPNASRFTAALTAYLERAPHALFEHAPALGELLHPLELANELRALLADGTTLIGWLGGFHRGPLTARQRERFAALLPAFQRRLAVARTIAQQQRASAALETVLDQLVDPAFILGPRGEIDGANRAARELGLERAMAALAATDQRIDRVPLAGTSHTLAIVRRTSELERCEGRVQRAADSWRLTPRQREVLLLVIQGKGNAQIAATLAIGERAVEMHITAILERACVNNRTSLIALVLGAICA